MELKLKKKICENLGWKGYPKDKKEFERLASFKTHDLDVLLHYIGLFKASAYRLVRFVNQ